MGNRHQCREDGGASSRAGGARAAQRSYVHTEREHRLRVGRRGGDGRRHRGRGVGRDAREADRGRRPFVRRLGAHHGGLPVCAEFARGGQAHHGRVAERSDVGGTSRGSARGRTGRGDRGRVCGEGAGGVLPVSTRRVGVAARQPNDEVGRRRGHDAELEHDGQAADDGAGVSREGSNGGEDSL